MGDRRSYAFFALQALAVLAAVVAVWFMLTQGKPWDARQWAGTVLVGTGASLWAVARFQLVGSFTVRAKAKELVTSGLYAKVRNPVYLFGTVLIAGFITLLQMPALWLVLAAVVVMQRIRARREAIVLEAAFGQAYREYRAKTWF